jgi:hypothetical protein
VKYQRFLALLTERAGGTISFRNAETPVFFERAQLEQMISAGKELAEQLLGNAAYLAAATQAIPEAFRVPKIDSAPLFVQADFGLDQNSAPKLVEIQGFPSLYAYQPTLAEAFRDAYGLDSTLSPFLEDWTHESYDAALQKAICAACDPKETFLLEIAPETQKTAPDFYLTEQRFGVKTLDVQQIEKCGRRLYAPDGTRIRRIYNRVIVDELVRKQLTLPFDFRDDLDVEWAGHPNWYFLLSKFSLPYLKHKTVPETHFLSELTTLPDRLEDWVLKPLFSFAGHGVVIGPSEADVRAVSDPTQWILQRRVDFVPTIETPEGPTKVEVRIMLVRIDGEYRAMTALLRLGRGKLLGVDQNRDARWVGASAAFIID